MTDAEERELLELAARAAGIERGAERIDCGISTTEADGRHRHLPRWNPLESDGDALRLAVDLRMIVRFYEGSIIVDCDGVSIEEHDLACRHAATRRAITRAAAEIARTQEQQEAEDGR